MSIQDQFINLQTKLEELKDSARNERTEAIRNGQDETPITARLNALHDFGLLLTEIKWDYNSERLQQAFKVAGAHYEGAVLAVRSMTANA